MKSAPIARNLLLLLALTAPLSPVWGAELHVDAARGSDGNSGLAWGQALATVREALTRAGQTAEADTVRVAQGSYPENLVVPSGVALEGGYPTGGGTRNPSLYTTTLDGSGVGSVVTVGPGATGVSIDGFRITGGAGLLGGGGIWAETSQVSITNNVVTGNSAPNPLGRGGGIAHVGPTPGSAGSVISGNVVQGNTVEDGNGGGIAIMEFDPPPGPGVQLTQNRIEGNTATGSDDLLGRGGGVYILENTALVEQNEILGNQAIATGRAAQAGNGGGLLILGMGSDPVVTRNTIRGNVALGADGAYGGSGGGVYAMQFSGEISENTIAENRAEGGDGDAAGFGGGLFVYQGSPTVTANVIQGNAAEGSGCLSGRGAGAYLSEGSTLFQGNRVEGNRNFRDGGPGDGPCWDDPAGCHCFVGGGLWSWHTGAGPTIEGSLFEGNYAADGGGLALAGTGSATLRHDRIRRNEAVDFAGAGMEVFAGEATLFNVEIVLNVGDGMLLRGDETDPSTATLTNVTIADNGLACPGPLPTCGIGLLTWFANGLAVRNSIIGGNGLSDWLDQPDANNDPSSPNTTWDYTDLLDSTVHLSKGTGNLAGADPLFTPGPLGQHYLGAVATGQAADSPCTDASGDTASGLGLAALTTRIDETPDAGAADLGFHYPSAAGSGGVRIWQVQRAGADLTLRFTLAAGADGSRIYRGDLTRLSVEYTHSTPFTAGQQECLVAAPAAFLTMPGALTGPGSFYYLVVPVAGGVEGSFGEKDLDGDGIGDGERTRPEESGADAVVNGCP